MFLLSFGYNTEAEAQKFCDDYMKANPHDAVQYRVITCQSVDSKGQTVSQFQAEPYNRGSLFGGRITKIVDVTPKRQRRSKK